MAMNVAEMLEALPVDAEECSSSAAALEALIEDLSQRRVPTGRASRLWTLGTLQAKIAAAYFAWWVRGWYAPADERERKLSETNLKAAIKLLGGMGYLRGAFMKLGQVLALYPKVVPQEFADLLGKLQFQAPPMHFSLVREFVRDELGDDPENLFEEFETSAFAAASLGQVHRARLKDTGRIVAIKIQYPNIARTIRADIRNMIALLLPMRLHGDWDNLRAQIEDVERMLTLETDYVQEAENLALARRVLSGEASFFVPRVHERYSTQRVLTMDYVDGVHLDAYLAGDPTQDERDRYGHLIALATFRLSYTGRMAYADPNAGNYFFMPDGRLGLVDFGCCHYYTPDDLDYLTEMERVSHVGGEAYRQSLRRAACVGPEDKLNPEHLRMIERWCDWSWEPLRHEGLFDFSDGAYFQRGVEMYGEIMRRRFVRSRPVNTWMTRSFVGLRALLTHLKARVDMRAIHRAETTVPPPPN